MSTKSSIIYGEDYHVYKELFDEKSIYVELNNIDFTAVSENGYKSITIRLPEDLAKKLNIVN